ncbi:hypothetical protein COEREDRAFT_12872 [Coemansia reversa NRRL 1564]|uniref:Uncharacterized protein n=1 Tax=Coemansia reversa (strain ATCC 12441 / NRRL 1564) TaxID=763665 RepID=A0A2G5BKH6_COERN|nr:hypothetical protein COEREDRAFT_12872 [Coemansia reversa NRRL 1564]|eukprot:PIA19508.1 hypothetical protein COEREDRAFT_12872 [Coemansia reversa NRRL 1564]
MSEEGEADFDVGQISEAPPTSFVTKLPENAVQEENHSAPGFEKFASVHGAETETGTDVANIGNDYINAHSRNGDYLGGTEQDPRGHGEYGDGRSQMPKCDSRYRDDEHYYRREERSTSRASVRASDYSRRTTDADPTHDDSRAMRHRDSRVDDVDYRESLYRNSRYTDRERDYHRAGYYHRYERESPRYKRREFGRSAYSRSGYGEREELGEDYSVRRDIDKERAIEELRSRVRATADRSAGEDISAPRSGVMTTPRVSSNAMVLEAGTFPSVHANASSGDGQPADGAAPTGAGNEPPAGMDDLEEGEHIETAVDVEPRREAEYDRNRTEIPLSGTSRGSDRYSRSHARSVRASSRSNSRRREYAGYSPYEPDGRRLSSRRDISRDIDGPSYRRRYDDCTERYEYRSREPYNSRSGNYSRYGDNSYPTRYSSRRSPDPRDTAYRPDRRNYSSRYERYDESDQRRYPQDEARSLAHPHSRSRSPLPLREENQRTRTEYEENYRRRPGRSASRGAHRLSQSPHGNVRGFSNIESPYYAEQDYKRSRYGDTRWDESGRHYDSKTTHALGELAASEDVALRVRSPPPPPPILHVGSGHGQPYESSSRMESPHYENDSLYHDYSTRAHRRLPRTPISAAHGQSDSRNAYGSRFEYEHHSRNPSSEGRHHQSYHGSHAPSPSASNMHPGMATDAVPELGLPAYSSGVDLYISRNSETSDWLAVREQVREQSKRILEISARARKTAFELSYANWGMQKAESQVQLATWQLERVEHGLGLSDRTLIESAALSDL